MLGRRLLFVNGTKFQICVQAVQKLMDRLEKAESVAANAEASRNAQVEAVVDQLLAFKQAQTAELAQRDSQVAALQTLVFDLQQQVSCFCISPLFHPQRTAAPTSGLPNLGGKLAELARVMWLNPMHLGIAVWYLRLLLLCAYLQHDIMPIQPSARGCAATVQKQHTQLHCCLLPDWRM